MELMVAAGLLARVPLFLGVGEAGEGGRETA